MHGEFVDESGEDVHGFAQIWVVPPAEKRSSKLASLVKFFTDQMGQGRFSDPGRAVDPVSITFGNIPLPRFIGDPVHDLIKD